MLTPGKEIFILSEDKKSVFSDSSKKGSVFKFDGKEENNVFPLNVILLPLKKKRDELLPSLRREGLKDCFFTEYEKKRIFVI